LAKENLGPEECGGGTKEPDPQEREGNLLIPLKISPERVNLNRGKKGGMTLKDTSQGETKKKLGILRKIRKTMGENNALGVYPNHNTGESRFKGSTREGGGFG